MTHQSTAVIAQIASRQHGVVTRTQLLRAGLQAYEIRHRVDSGALLREHPGVYRVGHRAPSVDARYLGAVLACGDDARLSGRAAAHLFGLLKGPVPPPEVTTPLKRRVDGVRVRRGPIDCADRATHRGIPVTSVPAPGPTSPPTSPSMTSREPATRPASGTGRRRLTSPLCSDDGHAAPAHRSSGSS